jgi:hypothetical protein
MRMRFWWTFGSKKTYSPCRIPPGALAFSKTTPSPSQPRTAAAKPVPPSYNYDVGISSGSAVLG